MSNLFATPEQNQEIMAFISLHKKAPWIVSAPIDGKPASHRCRVINKSREEARASVKLLNEAALKIVRLADFDKVEIDPPAEKKKAEPVKKSPKPKKAPVQIFDPKVHPKKAQDQAPKKDKAILIRVPEKSAIKSPCKAVWEIAEKMKKKNPSIKRKEVVEECVNNGIAFYTAKTQYQYWFEASKRG